MAVDRRRSPSKAKLTAFFRQMCCLGARLRLKASRQRERIMMAHNFAINDNVHHQLQGPQGRAGVRERSIYTIVTCLPIEADGRPRYRIKSKTENIERVVTEEQLSRLG
jgi:hypothetical protein